MHSIFTWLTLFRLAFKKSKKKDIPSIDHGATMYEPFRKNFYIEPSETQNMTEQEVEAFRAELDGIKIRVSKFLNYRT